MDQGEDGGSRVAARYTIPQSTLMDYVAKKHGPRFQTMGKTWLFLSKEVEGKLADNLRYMEKHGFKSNIKEKLELIGDYVKTCEIPSQFKGGSPGESWFTLFANRNGLTKPQPEKEFAVFKEYFNVLKDIIEDNDLKDSGKIWFIDETGYTITGEKIYRSDDKERNTTVLTACNAEGQKAPVFIVFKDDIRPRDLISNDEACYAVAENGWLTRNEFRDYFIKTFLRHLRKPPPILIAFNGHSSHIDIQLMEESRRANIIFIKIPKLLKVFSIFDSLKRKWETDLLNLKSCDSEQFCDMIITDFKNYATDVIKDGFRKAGICPFDDSVTEVKYGADIAKKWKEYELSLKGEAANKDFALNSITVNEFDELFVKEEIEEAEIQPEHENSSLADEIISQPHSAHSPYSFKYLGDFVHTSMSVLEASTQTAATLKRPAHDPEGLEQPRVSKDWSRARSSQTVI
ncbi:hypothetical protein MSG28_014861 [Choristoneura fumiferana]|uniref:Uncharacterized protein n=1 Tax=Choristoneura fumiferana TaxID=7141 RepID=A0ACC0JSZ0_CHOFU|nr:hypothetical protein MSG28_014861 [Choristoneura fumiferana]